MGVRSRGQTSFKCNQICGDAKLQRGIGQFPRQGLKKPWKLNQNYALDLLSLRFGAVTDDAMEFSKPKAPAREAVSA